MAKRYCGASVVLAWVALSVVVTAGRGAEPLIDAVQLGDVAAVKTLLQRGVDVNAPAADGSTALMWAVNRHNLTLVDQLIRAGANVSVTDRYGMAPLSMAAESGSAAIVERLLRAGADPNTTLPGGEIALMTAARTGNPDAVKALLAAGAGANVNAKETTRDQTALMWAAAQGRTEAVKLLIAAGADIRARSSEMKAFHLNTYLAGHKDANLTERLPMFTPLLFAVRGGHLDAVRALLDAGADVNDAGPDGTPTLHIAIINGQWDLAALLVDRGADVRAEVPGGTALHYVARTLAAPYMAKTSHGLPAPRSVTGTMSGLEIAEKILARGADPNARITKMLNSYAERSDKNAKVGLTPLMMAQVPPGAAEPAYARLLIAHGADPKLLSSKGTTTLMMAAGIGLSYLVDDDEEAFENVKMLVEFGMDVNATNDDGDTALHGAAFRNYLPILEYLVEHGAKLDAKNKIGWTPLMEARWTRRGLLTTRPEAEAFLRKQYEAQGVPVMWRLADGLAVEGRLPTREEAIEKLYSERGVPIISCPEGRRVKSEDGQAVVITYPEATATSKRQYAKIETKCTPAPGFAFPVGVTTVSCTATDDRGSSDSCAVLMRVVRP